MRGKVLITLLVLASMHSAWAGTGKTLYSFTASADGANPAAGVTLDSAGHLYGTTVDCHSTFGSVYRMTPSSSGWQFQTILPFTDNGDGACPESNVILDSSGNLYGTTRIGGIYASAADGYGVVFQLAPSEAPQRQWTESVYYNFQGYPDGGLPVGGLVMDKSGNLYGTTDAGGDPQDKAGTVFQLVPDGIGGWNYNLLHTFQGTSYGEVPSDGGDARGNLVVDEAGNVFGLTYRGGDGGGLCNDHNGCGVLFELSPGPDGSWTYQTVHAFSGASTVGTPGKDGAYPWSHLVRDQAGNLYGTTELGGKYGYGTVFEFKMVGKKKQWKEVVLHNFNLNPFVPGKHDGVYPETGVTFDQAGNLYGTTSVGGAHDAGTVYKLSPNANHTSWQETVLYSFTGVDGDGAYPSDFGGVAVDNAGNVYGTTFDGGTYGFGTVFEVSQ
jgi:uncharacterized repeat protein (TIGR03803 family)